MPTSTADGYIHKLRLDAIEGGHVEVDATPREHRQGGWILAKFIGLSITSTALLLLVARELL